MLEFRPIGYRVLAEMVRVRKLPSPIEMPDKSKLEGMAVWIVRAIGDEMILVTGTRVPIYQVKIGDEIQFDVRRSCQAADPFLCDGKLYALVDVEGITAVVSEKPDTAKIVTAHTVPKLKN